MDFEFDVVFELVLKGDLSQLGQAEGASVRLLKRRKALCICLGIGKPIMHMRSVCITKLCIMLSCYEVQNQLWSWFCRAAGFASLALRAGTKNVPAVAPATRRDIAQGLAVLLKPVCQKNVCLMHASGMPLAVVAGWTTTGHEA